MAKKQARQFKEKAASIDAVRFLSPRPENEKLGAIYDKCPEWLFDETEAGNIQPDATRVVVTTADGEQVANEQDYIVREADGTLHVMTTQEFRKNYERV